MSAIQRDKELSSNKPKYSCFIGANSNQKVKLSPLVEISILDAYQRRPTKEKRAIGSLLGYISEGNILHITDSFSVIHSDDSARNISMDPVHYSRMLSLKQCNNNITGQAGAGTSIVNGVLVGSNGQVITNQNGAVSANSMLGTSMLNSGGSKEVVVGWYSITSPGEKNSMEDGCVSIHNWYMSDKSSGFKSGGNGPGRVTSPVYLQVEVKTGLELKCFSSDFVPESQKNLLQFYELPISRTINDESQILQLLAGGCQDNYISRTENASSDNCIMNVEGERVALDSVNTFQRQLNALQTAFTTTKTYVDNVISKKEKPNTLVGRQLKKELDSIARSIEMELGSSESDGNVDQNEEIVKETLMVRYLSVLCKTQVSMVEKLSSLVDANGN